MNYQRRFLLGAIIGLNILFFNNCSRFSTLEQVNSNLIASDQASSTGDNLQPPSSPMPQPQQQQPNPTPQTPTPQPPPVVNDSTWTNEPAGSQRMVDCAMDTPNCAGQVKGGTFWDVGAMFYNSPMKIVSDPTALRSPSSVADAPLYYSGVCDNGGKTPLACGVGGGHLTWFNNAGTREIYFGAYFKINADYGSSLPGMSKIFFLRTYENNFGAPNTNGVFLIRGRGETRDIIFNHNTGGIDNSHTCAADSGLICNPNVGSASFNRGKWVKFEACVRASTSNTARDGVVRWWVDGKLGGDYRNINYGSMVANEWVWNQTWDGYGNGQGFTSEAHQYLDHLVISVPPNGGCASR